MGYNMSEYNSIESNEVQQEKYKEMANNFMERNKYEEMKRSLNLMAHLRSIPKIWEDWSMSIRNNRKMRGK